MDKCTHADNLNTDFDFLRLNSLNNCMVVVVSRPFYNHDRTKVPIVSIDLE